MSTQTLQVHQFPCLSDNYGFLVHDPATGNTAVIDTPEVPAIMAALQETGWTLSHILNTHHHFDHAGGNLEIQEKTGCTIVGPRAEASRIPGIVTEVGDGDTVMLGGQSAKVFDVPGHTAGHIAYWFEDSRALFSGDTLFALGCGRLFEGTADQMWDSLSKFNQLPDETEVFCAHEYTQSNGRFALSIDPHNKDLVARMIKIGYSKRANFSTLAKLTDITIANAEPINAKTFI